MKKPETLSEAIHRLEEQGLHDIKEILQRDYGPLLDEAKQKAEKNPLLTMGLIGVIMFLVGWFLGSRKR